jgi:glycosyltransferase involved in cell wall biosynthesis
MSANFSGSTSDQDPTTAIGERSTSTSHRGPRPSPTVSVVVPTYREVENLPALIERLEQLRREFDLAVELLIMDDDSQDGSEDLVAKLALPWDTRSGSSCSSNVDFRKSSRFPSSSPNASSAAAN